ncbi:amidohydrolase family protein [Candidatus Bathyarchaeota archaeon]|nr:amidohydrolase family protein [Candidatus Bathyarchaeota archaeon]
MLDFTSVPVIDNHCHTYNPKKSVLDPESLAREFYHGIGDVPKIGISPRLWGYTDELRYHFPNIGVVQTMVCQLSRLLGCEAKLEEVAAERNRRTSESFAGYVELLYQDAGIVGTVLDSDLPLDDPLFSLFPGRVMRLFQMGPIIQRLLRQSESYKDLLRNYQEALDRAIRRDGFVGVKSHLAEEVGFGIEPISDTEAKASFSKAKEANLEAYKKLYTAIFTATLIQCQELEVPVHVHTGITGGLWNGPISDADPFLLVPLIRRPEFLRTRVILLHGSYPWIQHAALVAHALPNVWVDMSWATPWISLRIVECYRDVIGISPLSKLLIGSGGHGTPEIAWLSAKLAKIALGKALGDDVSLGLLSQQQAEKAGRMILHDNAAKLYGLIK